MIIAVSLVFIACNKNEINPEVSWLIEATHKDLDVSTFIDNNKSQSIAIKKGSKQTINKSYLSKMEIRCGGCEYKVNKEEIRGDVAFFANGHRQMLY